MGAEQNAVFRHLIEQHARYTNSRRAQEVLKNWGQYRAQFAKVFPKEYKRALAELGQRRMAA